MEANWEPRGPVKGRWRRVRPRGARRRLRRALQLHGGGVHSRLPGSARRGRASTRTRQGPAVRLAFRR
eukprot:6696035-Pyramimonas_sp.AAC.1